MSKIFTFIVGVILAMPALSKEIITVYSPYSAGHAGTAASHRVFEVANNNQSRYQFMLELKPGAQGIIALRTMTETPSTRLAIINASFVENVDNGKIQEQDYVPVHVDGNACWAVATTHGNEKLGLASIKGLNEIMVGTVGVGNATHLTALQIGEKYNIPVKYVGFKSNYDALINMIGNNGVNFILERVSVINQFRDKNPKMQMLAMSCPKRHPEAPNVKTLIEQGVTAPYVFNTVVAGRAMPEDKRQELGKILDQATLQVGAEEIRRLSDMRPSIFDNVSVEDFHRQNVSTVRALRQKHKSAIIETRD